ncbi:hypothetical protein [Streptomyces sp. NPDC059909]|uniref:hypothetical protein n=1 Tax=Streptomyces sp. NPDC059909 TaxID=3346998 RepID=UPI0036630519
MDGTKVGRTPLESAQLIAKNAVPEVKHAFDVMTIPADVYAEGVVNGHGIVFIALRSAEAYDLARWVRTHAPERKTIHPQTGGCST